MPFILLDSVVSSPLQSCDGEDLSPSLNDKASRLAFGLISSLSICPTSTVSLQSVRRYLEDLMDDLLKEGYNVLKHSSEYGHDQWLRGNNEESLAESLTRLFLGDSSANIRYLGRRVAEDGKL